MIITRCDTDTITENVVVLYNNFNTTQNLNPDNQHTFSPQFSGAAVPYCAA